MIEAGDASGKATQTRLLFDRLRDEGRRVRIVEFPDYSSDSSALVRMYLRGDFGCQASDTDAYAASVFFAADRYASFQTKWKKYYESGEIILADRYATSNLAHQAVKLPDGPARDAYMRWVDDFEYVKLGLPRPDAVIFLDMSPAASFRLLAARADKDEPDIHEKDTDYLLRCHDAYLKASQKFGWSRVVCSEGDEPREPSAIAGDVYDVVSRLLDTP